jgi:hypothetical protein
MTTREKIIIGLMCVTIAYGAYELLSSDASTDKPQNITTHSITELQNTVAKLSQQLVKGDAKQDSRYKANSAAVEWSKDPFIHSTEPLKKTLEAPAEKEKAAPRDHNSINLTYSGFLEVGQLKLAIINGLEYTEGEALETTEYYVRSIAPRHVVIGKINSPKTIRLPLQEALD